MARIQLGTQADIAAASAAEVTRSNATYPTVVAHGSTAGTARPAGAALVEWVGSVAPSNATSGDRWYDQAAELWKRLAGSVWVAAGSTTFVPLKGGMSTLGRPLYIAHRFGSNVVPEETLEGARAAVAGGVTALEYDCIAMADGSCIVMHDNTVDRTTTASANSADLTAARVPSLVADSSAWFLPAGTWPDTKIPTHGDMCREFGNRVLLVPEAKLAGAGAPLVAKALQYGISPDHMFVQSFILAELAPAVAAGYPTILLSPSDAADPVATKAAGVKWMGVSTAATSGYVASCIAAGLEVAVYTVDRQNERDAWLALGVTGFFTNDPGYLAGTSRRTSDAFKAGVPYPGHLVQSAFAGTDRGTFNADGSWGWSNASADTRIRLLGEISPLTLPFTINVQLQFDTLGTTGVSYAGFGIMESDKEWTNTAASPVNGYHFLVRSDGVIRIYRVVAGVATQIATTTTTAFVAGAYNSIRISATSLGVLTLSRPDIGAPNSVTFTDTAYVPRYPHFARGSLQARIKSLAVT